MASKRLVLIGFVVLVLIIGGLVLVVGKGAKGPASQGAGAVPKADPAISSGADAEHDAEREADLVALQGKLETYYEQSGKYPTLANMNDAEFRARYLAGLDDAALRDPEATDDVKGLTSNPEQGAYAYKPEPNGCDNGAASCTGYTLLAYLSTGETPTKTSLN